MKKIYLIVFILSMNSILVFSDVPNEYIKGLSIWFDTPNDLSGKAVWQHGPRWKNKQDSTWEKRSLPLGNGSIGANILGSISAERITLNEKTLWRGGPNTKKGAGYYWNVNKKSAGRLQEIRQDFQTGNRTKACRITRENFNGLAAYEEKDETPFRFGSYTTMGELYIETGLSEIGLNNYHRILSLDSALALVQFDKDGINYHRKYFISYPDSVMVMKFMADSPGLQNLVLSYCPNNAAKSVIAPDGENGLVYTGVLDNNGMKFVIRLKAFNKGGSLKVENDRFIVKDADEVVFLLVADTDYQMNFAPDFNDPLTYVGVDPLSTTRKMMDNAARKSYDSLFHNHVSDYGSLFNRVKFKLNQGKGVSTLPTDKRLVNYRNGNPDYQLEELLFQYGRYLLIACSRPGNMPANLQGMWHNNIDGPWRVDYHNNINLQMNYWLACTTNLAECTWPLIDYIRSLVKPGERTARAYYNARGWTTSISSNIFGFTSPLSSTDMSWNLIPIAGPWLATHIWEYYDYTQDRKFLKEIGYELIKSSAQFTVDHLWHKPDGSYVAAPSTSPEHGPIDEGTTFVHAVVREILLDAILASKVLGVDIQERRQWEEVLEKLAPYRIGNYGQLQEWSTDMDDPKDQHRHVNHLFGLHPGHTISPVTTPELAQAAKVVLEHRGDGASGWSMGWKLNLWARLHDGNRAYRLYGNLLKYGTQDNLWNSHPPFQIDGNFGGTAGVNEMLLQSHMGFIHLLPALPDAWKDGLISGICAKGNFEVSVWWKNGLLEKAVVYSKLGVFCRIKYGDQMLAFKTRKGGKYELSLLCNRISVRKIKM